MVATYDFANILLSGPCNLRCPACIGRALPRPLQESNLDRFPLRGLERFVALLRTHGLTQVTLTGTNTDPQLYRHEELLLERLQRGVPGARVNLHTNGLLALRKMATFNRYHRATISLPSFRPETCRVMTGRAVVLDLERIVAAARIPIKISTLVTEHNLDEIPSIIQRCRELGIRRMALRRLYGETRSWTLLEGRAPTRRFAGNPVYDLEGMEVTLWDFSRATLRCLNLFADGTIGEEYELTRSEEAPR
jgi:MoaA/NifB/PqqE/SkfB family radical SAM enzyme